MRKSQKAVKIGCSCGNIFQTDMNKRITICNKCGKNYDANGAYVHVVTMACHKCLSLFDWLPGMDDNLCKKCETLYDIHGQIQLMHTRDPNFYYAHEKGPRPLSIFSQYR